MAGSPHGESLLAGRYRLEERLSDQDGSSVWKATDESLIRTVTVRTFAPDFGRTGEAVAAARSAAQLSDPRLVQIFDADDRGEQPYIVTEWPGGERLDEVIAIGPLEPVRAAQIITEAAEGMTVAHAAGLAHLCLTPDLLWWNRWGEVKISGLGTAAVLAGAEADNPAEADTRGLARLLYAALTGYWPGPEQTRLPAAPRHRRAAGQPGPGAARDLQSSRRGDLPGAVRGSQQLRAADPQPSRARCRADPARAPGREHPAAQLPRGSDPAVRAGPRGRRLRRR